MNFVVNKQKIIKMTSEAQPSVKYGSFVTHQVLKRIIIYVRKILHKW